MEKMPTLFVRDWSCKECPATRDVTPGCEWVVRGEGYPTQKLDGTACLVRDGKLYKRYTRRSHKAPPPDFEPAGDPAPDGKQPGWMPVGDGPEDRWHRFLIGFPVSTTACAIGSRRATSRVSCGITRTAGW